VDVSGIRWSRVGTIALFAWFLTLSVMRLQVLATGEPATDLRLYLRGSAAWLNGDDPWLVHMGTLHYAAAPPSLLLMAPFALLPEAVAVVLLTALAFAASLWTLRRLHLPLWWIIWPPLVDNLWNGNPQLFIVPLLLGPAAFLAPVVKAYGIVPLLIQWRWRMMAITVAIGLVTLPILPWATFFGHLSETAGFLTDQSQGGMSAWFFPILVPFAAIALVVMGREKASWWFIPALWPATQWYYTLMAMPAMTALTAAILAPPVQGLPAVAAVVAAAEIWYRRRAGTVPGAEPGDQPAAATSDGRTTRAPSS
jgi:hypothetical protein